MASLTLSPQYALNALKFEARDFVFEWEEKEHRFEFVPSKPSYEPVVWIKGTIGSANFDIGLKEWPKLHFAGREILQVDLKVLPQLVAKSILEGAFLSVIQSLEEALNQEIELTSIQFGAAQAPYTERLEFIIKETSQASTWIDGALFIPENLLPLLAEAWNNLPFKSPEKTNLPVEGKVVLEIGRQTLTLKEFRSLRENDILLLGEGPDFEHGEVWLTISEDQSFQADWQSGKITLRSPLLFQTLPFNSSMDIDLIPLDLQFVVGQKKLTLKELRALKPGYSFDFPASLEGPVKLMANGQLVGTGEIVMVEDRLGVRLIGLGHIEDLDAKSSAKRVAITSKAKTPVPFPEDEEETEEEETEDYNWEDDEEDESHETDDEDADEDDNYGVEEDEDDDDEK